MRSRKKITGFTKEAREVLKKYSYPGNVRELENIIERSIILEKTGSITPESLPTGIRTLKIETFDAAGILSLDDVAKKYAEKVLKMMKGNKTKTAELLGISRTSLWKILKKE